MRNIYRALLAIALLSVNIAAFAQSQHPIMCAPSVQCPLSTTDNGGIDPDPVMRGKVNTDIAYLYAHGGGSSSLTINAQTGTSYAILATDTGKLVTLSNASAVAVSLSAATTTGFGAGFYTQLQNKGAGTVTVTPATSTINGSATLVIPQNTGCWIVSDGTNYQVSSCTAFSGTATNLAGGALNDIPVQSSAGVTAYIAAPSGATALVLEWNGTNIVWAAGTPLSGLTSVSSLSLTDLVGDQPGATGNLESATVAQLQAQHLNPLGTITASSLTPDCSWPNEVNTAKVTTATGIFTINNPTVGTPTDVYSCKLIVLFSNSQTAAFGSAYYGGTVALPTTFAANQQKYLFLYASTAVATTAGWDFSADALGFSHYRQQISFGLPRLGKFAGRPATNDDYFKPLWKDAI